MKTKTKQEEDKVEEEICKIFNNPLGQVDRLLKMAKDLKEKYENKRQSL